MGQFATATANPLSHNNDPPLSQIIKRRTLKALHFRATLTREQFNYPQEPEAKGPRGVRDHSACCGEGAREVGAREVGEGAREVGVFFRL